MRPRCLTVALAALGAALLVTACEREARQFDRAPAGAATSAAKQSSDVVAGGAQPRRTRSGPYDENAYAIAEGKRLFTWFNCVGCHAHGGGGSGPALMDDKWIYGYEPEAIYTTIVEGRPNGMPSFGPRIPEQQVWQLVAYVRSMSGLIRHDAIPGRSDALQAVEPELRRDELTPRTTGAPAPP